MNEWLPLLAGLAVPAFFVRQRVAARAVHADLRSVIAAQPGAAVTDAGGAPVLAVARALELEPFELLPSLPEPRPPRRAGQDPAWEARETIRPLGLELVELVRAPTRALAPGAGVPGRTEMAGVRHGRHVVVRLEETSSVIHLSGRFAPFELRARAQRWDGLDASPRMVGSWMARLEPSRRWDGCRVVSGADGLRLLRERETSRSWMHDLWLAEQLADAARAARTPVRVDAPDGAVAVTPEVAPLASAPAPVLAGSI